MGLEMKYFVLKPRSKYKKDIHAKASRAAMVEYARIIETENPKLAESLRLWTLDETVSAMEFYKD